MRVSGMTIHDVKPDDVKVLVRDHGWFATLEICIGSMSVSMFTDSEHTATRIAIALANAQFESEKVLAEAQ